VTETPLAGKIRRLIEANGPISVADYMALCLGDPALGYYRTRDPFGSAGDFVTAPEISQMFGEILGAWLIHAWRQGGSPSPVRLVELGPGRGTLMADILRVAAKIPEFLRAVSVDLIETSEALRRRQAAAVSEARVAIEWRAALHEVPRGPLLLVANEFFDALPVRQFMRAEGAWCERVVGLDARGRLAFGLGRGQLDGGPDAPANSVIEHRPAADALMTEIGERIAEHGGTALVVDYGYVTAAFGETLQAVRGHRFADPLESPGETDLTAHVDFAALACAARAAGAAAHGPMPQGEFLMALGLVARAEKLAAGGGDAARTALAAAVRRLTHPDEMGTLFKVLAVTQDGICPPPFADWL